MGTKMSKKSVVTITVMACLLAVAVATTIVLAAFSANKTATTTVQFANGVQIKIIGAYKTASDAGDADPFGRTAPVALLWGCTETTQTANTTSNSLTNVSNSVTFNAISIQNGPATGEGASANAYLIAKPTISCTVGTGTSNAPTTEQAAAATAAMTTALTGLSGWIKIGATDWYAYSTDTTNITGSTTALTGATFTTVNAGSAAIPFLAQTTLTSDPIDNLAGATYVAAIEVYAVNAAAADAIADLNTKVFGAGS